MTIVKLILVSSSIFFRKLLIEVILSFTLSKVDRSPLILIVFNVQRNEIAAPVNEYKSSGTYEVEFNGEGLTSGIYFYQLKAENFTKTMKMVILK